MKKSHAHQKAFAFIFTIAAFFVLCALAGCDADSVSNEELSLDLSDPDVVAALFAASENNDSWAEEPELVAYSADKKNEVWC